MSPFEMISGPDLGGGFLHQLSVQREGATAAFLYHAQDGGMDAGGPPPGPPDAFGYARTAHACPLGGPRCWHRGFELSETETPRVRIAYNRMRFVMEAMLAQAYGGREAAIDEALVEVATRIEASGPEDPVPWYVGGSTAARLLGGRIVPHDIDLGTTAAGVDRIAAALREYLIEPVAPTEWPLVGRVHGARAFVGTLREGARVEWGVHLASDPDPFGEWEGSQGSVRTISVPFRGHDLRATRPEYALVRAYEKRVSHRVDALVELVRKLGPDRELLDRLMARSGIAPADREALRTRCVA